MFGDKLTIGDALLVSVVSILVVFVVLLAISYMITLVAKVLDLIMNKGKKAEPVKSAPAAEPVVEEEETDDSDKFILAAAAIAAYLGTDRFIVRGVRKVNDEGSWATVSRTGFLND